MLLVYAVSFPAVLIYILIDAFLKYEIKLRPIFTPYPSNVYA